MAIVSAGFVATNMSAYDWSDYATHFKNYTAPSGDPATTAKTTAVPRQDGGIEQWEPATTSPSHWNQSPNIGAYRLKERIWHPTNHDNFWDWAFPMSEYGALVIDPIRSLPNAVAGARVYDANGDLT